MRGGGGDGAVTLQQGSSENAATAAQPVSVQIFTAYLHTGAWVVSAVVAVFFKDSSEASLPPLSPPPRPNITLSR